MTVYSDRVKRWRVSTKNKIVSALGGKCIVCGYNKCPDALDLHHVDPAMKEFGFGQIRARPIAIEKIVAEVRKCVLLCANCHRELHAGLITPPSLGKIDESYFVDGRKARHYD